MWVSFHSVVAALTVSVVPLVASAGVVADYTGDFQPNTPKPGWSYLWNANGPLGNSANYVALTPTANQGGDYETAIPGSSLAVTATVIIPGIGTTQDPGQIERCAILAYTITAADIANNGHIGYLDDYHFTVPLVSVDGVSASIFVNNSPILPGLPLPPGMDYDRSAPDAYPMPLGVLNPGDTVYVAVGSRFTDNGDQLGIKYTINLVPEPASLSILSFVGIALLSRRRR